MGIVAFVRFCKLLMCLNTLYDYIAIIREQLVMFPVFFIFSLNICI